jgi:hypothetical protein
LRKYFQNSQHRSHSSQVLTPSTDDGGYLHVPPVERQWLISPPASPPLGWEQPREDKPIVDINLLAAMAQLSPGAYPTKSYKYFLL